MSKIDVDLEEIYAAQQAVYNYIEYQKQQTNASTTKVEEMGTDWKGTDYERFKNKWTQLTNESNSLCVLIAIEESFVNCVDLFLNLS